MTDCVEMQPIASMVVGGHPRVPAVANTSAMGAVANRRHEHACRHVRRHDRNVEPMATFAATAAGSAARSGPQVRTGARVMIRGNGS